MGAMLTVFRRELAGYFATPVAWVFIVIFLLTTAAFAFYLGSFFERGQADLLSFFTYLPWLYLFLIPAIGMRLWSEERKTGTIELLLTLPISVPAAVLGKFLAAWAFVGIALALTFPFWLTVSYLGNPDHGVIIASYIGALLMAGGYLAITSCLSSLTQNQVIAFVVSTGVCFLFTVSGTPIVLEFVGSWAPELLVDQIAGFSFITHFQSIIGGVIDLRDLVFFASLIGVWLFANVIVIEHKKFAG